MISRREDNCQRLMSVPGIGPMISTAMVAAIGTGEAFERGRNFGAWLGLVPRQYSTGGKLILGRISKRGSKYLRTPGPLTRELALLTHKTIIDLCETVQGPRLHTVEVVCFAFDR
jgi:transposase